jgi:sterol desaturase/sphingolipid hydroxylase (fatty acid hydroxylase superfamily)
MHKPSIPFIENWRCFRFIERHHAIHHVHMDKNLDVLLPLVDPCLGSLVTAPPQSVPTRTNENARRTERRFSSYGRRLREEVERWTAGVSS